MQVHFSSSSAHDMRSGVTSMIYWESPDIEEIMNHFFRIKPSEKIDYIIISPDGIKAKIILSRSEAQEDSGASDLDNIF